MTMSTSCPQGHEIRSQADRSTQGYCRRCKADDDRERYIAQKAILSVAKQFEAIGVKFQNDGVPVAVEEVAEQLLLRYLAANAV